MDIDALLGVDIHDRMSSFGRKVRDIRKRAGLTQTEFAARLGVGQSTVSRWESLKYEQWPETEALIKIANFANIPTSSLWNDDETIHRRADDGMFVKVLGRAESGCWSEIAKFEPEDEFEVQLPGPKNWVDYSIEGFVIADESMNRIYTKHSIVFVMSAGGPDEAPVTPGDRVLVVRKNDHGLLETTVREFRVADDGKAWLWPISSHPLFQAPFSVDPTDDDGIASVHIMGIVAAAFTLERVAHILLD